MAPLIMNTIQHFTHPEHSLTLCDSNTGYLCDGCKTPGIGKRYRCHGCEFDLHEYCGTCPMNLSSFMHPNHSLKLVVRKTQGNRQFDRICNVCCDSVEGLFYRCEICEFDVHPLCTQLPETLRHVLQHFTHPEHSLTLCASNTGYLCDGCKTPGIGKRYRCHGCEFDLHEYCGTCPMNLSSFMHPNHSLKLVVRKQQPNRQFDRICNVCCDSVEGLFYRCELCEFDVHPLCTQLPETLRHALHQAHPLRLLGSSEPGTCAVCRGACNPSSWRYRCQLCQFDIHIGCLVVQCEKKTSSHQGIPSSSNAHHNNAPQPQHQSSGRIGQVMFGLVKTLGIGVISNMIFGVDVSPFFSV